MIVFARDNELFFVTQPDHAAFAAELASLWREPELAEHPRRDRILKAIREHDNGWQEADAAPRVNENGAPLSFETVPAEWRREIWRRGTDRFLKSRSDVALLINEHALELHRRESADADWQPLLAIWRERRETLLEMTATTEEELEADYFWLSLLDRLSLLVCTDRRAPAEQAGRAFSFDGTALRIEPFPFAGVTTFRIAHRRLPRRDFASDRELAVALARERWQPLEIKVRPAATDSPA